MSALTVTLGADITALRRGIASANELVASSARRMGRLTGAGLAGLGRGGAAALQKGFGVATTALKVGIGSALAGGAAAMGVGVKAVNAAADFEQTRVAFTTLIGDAARAEETLARLRELGAKTPFQFPDLADAGRKLIAFGEDSESVPETLRRIGDIAAGIQAPVGDLAELYGKARVQGRLFSQDIRQLQRRGIPITAELAKQFGVAESEVMALVSAGRVGFADMEAAIAAMTSEGGKFHGMMAAQSRTTSGLISTLRDNIHEVFLTLGEPINDAIRPLIAQAIEMVQKLTPLAKEAGERVKDAVQFVIAAFQSGQIMDLIGSSLRLGFAEGVNRLLEGMRMAVEFFWTLITDGSMWKSLGTILLGVVAGFGAALLAAFQTPILYLQAGMEWVVSHLLKGLLKIPGMESLMGIRGEFVETDFGRILRDRQEFGADLFGMNFRRMGEEASALIGQGVPQLADRVAEAAKGAAGTKGDDVIDTTALRKGFDDVVAAIRLTMPEPEALAEAGKGTVATQIPDITGPQAVARLAPVVTSLGRVGGGGYSPGLLDSQRENNRLTGETNRLLRETNQRIARLGGESNLTASFG